MPAIPLNKLGSVYAVKAPPWAKSPITIRALQYPKGVTPPHLKQYHSRLAEAARECAKETVDLRGSAERVTAMNNCVKARLGR